MFSPDDFALPTGEWPYTAADLNRLDNSDDASFYDAPRFVTHIDDFAIESLTNYYRGEIASMSAKKGGGKMNIARFKPSPLTPHPSPLTPHPSPLTPHPSPLTPH